MTESKIVKAIGLCNGIPYSACDECAYQNNTRTDCVEVLAKDTIDLINSKNAEIERLKYLLEYEEAKYNRCAKLFCKVGAKEFAERLKELLGVTKFSLIDDLLKELEG